MKNVIKNIKRVLSDFSERDIFAAMDFFSPLDYIYNLGYNVINRTAKLPEISEFEMEKCMKIVIINGSPRNNGATSKLLHTIEQMLISYDDVNVEFVNIGELNINACSGCCSCYKLGKCYIKDDAENLSNKIALSDGLIIGSPTYASNISGQLKTFIDRGHFVIEQLLYKKYAISIATGENYGSKDTGKILNKLLQYSGAFLSGNVICNVPFNNTPCNEKIEHQLEQLSKRIYTDIKTQKKYPLQSIFHKAIFEIGIKPFVKSKGNLYQGVITKWENNNIFT